MTAMLNWYRALAQRPLADWPPPRVAVPTTIIWGLKDFALRGEIIACEADDKGYPAVEVLNPIPDAPPATDDQPATDETPAADS